MNAILCIAVITIFLIIKTIKKPIRNPIYQGYMGEKHVVNILKSLPQNYYVINNVIVPNRQGTSQIDHVVVSTYGIFVIETKNYSGWVFGSENSEKWKETFRTTKGCYFRNPIKQNWGHVYALAEYLNLSKRVFKAIVVFSNKALLKVDATTPVIYMYQLKDHILSYSQEIIPAQDVEMLYNRINKANLVGTDMGNKHVHSVQNNIGMQRIAIQQGKCPRCRGDLLLRNGRYGAFYGCSNYPSCKFTHSLYD